MITGPLIEYTGNVLLSHGRETIVPSTSVDLTSVFGMGTGVTPPVMLPEKSKTIMKYRVIKHCRSKFKN